MKISRGIRIGICLMLLAGVFCAYAEQQDRNECSLTILYTNDIHCSYENYPLAGRAARLERYIDAGAKFYLAGHTHTMLQRGWKGMAMLNAENTCMNFDERPFGFRLLTVRPDASFTWEFQAI